MTPPKKKVANGDGRDPDNGRFAVGWKGGPGNPVLRHQHELHQAIRESGTPEKAKKLLNHYYKLAFGKEGVPADTTAGKIWLAYTCGKPRQDVVVTGDGSIADLVALIRETQSRLMQLPEVRKVMAKEVRK